MTSSKADTYVTHSIRFSKMLPKYCSRFSFSWMICKIVNYLYSDVIISVAFFPSWLVQYHFNHCHFNHCHFSWTVYNKSWKNSYIRVYVNRRSLDYFASLQTIGYLFDFQSLLIREYGLWNQMMLQKIIPTTPIFTSKMAYNVRFASTTYLSKHVERRQYDHAIFADRRKHILLQIVSITLLWVVRAMFLYVVTGVRTTVAIKNE